MPATRLNILELCNQAFSCVSSEPGGLGKAALTPGLLRKVATQSFTGIALHYTPAEQALLERLATASLYTAGGEDAIVLTPENILKQPFGGHVFDVTNVKDLEDVARIMAMVELQME